MSNKKIMVKLENLINKTLESETSSFVIHKLKETMDISSLGINSFLFIKLVVAIEKEFDFEFENEQLLVNNFRYIGDIVKYIQSHISAID